MHFVRNGFPVEGGYDSRRLWLVPETDIDNSNNLELVSQLDNSIFQHSGGMLGERQVMGKRCRRSCLHVMTEEKGGT